MSGLRERAQAAWGDTRRTLLFGTILAGCTSLLTAVMLDAQSAHVSTAAGQRVALRVPPAAFDNLAAGTGPMAEAERVGSELRLNGNQGWMSAGLAPLASFQVAERRVDAPTRRLVIRLQDNSGRSLTLSIPLADTSFALARLIAPAADSGTVQVEIREAVKKRLFSGAMSAVSPAGQDRLLQLIDRRWHLSPVKVERFEGQPYLVIPPERESGYTCSEKHEAQRWGGVIEEITAPVVRNIGWIDPEMTGPFGFVITVTLKTKAADKELACVDPVSGPAVTLYVMADAARQFAAGKISSQELIDLSAVLVGGRHVKVDLK